MAWHHHHNANKTSSTWDWTPTDRHGLSAMALLHSAYDGEFKKKDAGTAAAVDEFMGSHAQEHCPFSLNTITSTQVVSMSSPTYLDDNRQYPLLVDGSKRSPMCTPDDVTGIQNCKHNNEDCKLCALDAKQNSGIKAVDSMFLELSSSSSLTQRKSEKVGFSPEGQLFLGETQQDTSGTQSLEEQHSSTGTGSGDSLTGLHLGKRNYLFDDVSAFPGGDNLKPPPQSSSCTPLIKKVRASSVQLQTPRCQVHGCNLDLKDAKPYHRRHKVCNAHSKAEKVIVANLEQRFCQQCSRFHVLEEFDEVKRSCRKRLAGHNERRRKQHPDALSLHARYSSIFQEWPFFNSMMTLSPWGDAVDSRTISWSGLWPNWEDRKGYSLDMIPSSMEEELLCSGFPLQMPLQTIQFGAENAPLLLQSPKEITSRSTRNDLLGERWLHYVTRPFEDVGNGITISASATNVKPMTLSGLESVSLPATRVPESGCALSLLSVGPLVTNVLPSDLPSSGSLCVQSLVNEPPSYDSLMSKGIGNEQLVLRNTNNAVDKGFNGLFEQLPWLSGGYDHELKGPRPAVELMQILPLAHWCDQQESQLGINLLGNLPYSDQSTFIAFNRKIE